MFAPDEIIFAPTGRCNLACAHCRATRFSGPLSADAAIALLEEARDLGIERVGFSGGEPFLELDFLCAVSEAAVRLDYAFDRVMTNGVWWKNEAELRGALGRLADAGFDGTIGLSVDSYHGQTLPQLTAFLEAVFETFGRRDCAELVWVASGDDAPLFGLFGELAAALGGELFLEDGLPAAIGDGSGDDSGYDDPDALFLRLDRIPYSPPADRAAWDAAEWFEDDYCAGPGQVLYVHPDGRVAACCGFANERDELILGRLGIDGAAALLAAGASKPHVQSCYVKGLGLERQELERKGVVFPGKTADLCAFCDYLCSEGLARR